MEVLHDGGAGARGGVGQDGCRLFKIDCGVSSVIVVCLVADKAKYS
jgi:hypothetical protein